MSVPDGQLLGIQETQNAAATTLHLIVRFLRTVRLRSGILIAALVVSGIAGAAWSAKGNSLPRSVLEKMTDVLAHRGPDDRGFYCSHQHGAAESLRAARRRAELLARHRRAVRAARV